MEISALNFNSISPLSEVRGQRSEVRGQRSDFGLPTSDIRHPTSDFRAADLQIEKLAGNPRVSEEQKVDEVGRQFEAVMLRQILTDATKKMFSSDAEPESSSAGIYKDMITNTLADSISRSGEFGLARSLAKQLQHEFKTDEVGQRVPPVLPQATSATAFSEHDPSPGQARRTVPLQPGQAGSAVPLHLKP
jgi:Rod binding domain-containing protein